MILEEVNLPYPWFPKCGIFVLHKALIDWHLTKPFSRRGEESKQQHLEEDEAQVEIDMSITAYGIPLDTVTSFKYLGILLSLADNTWPLVVHNFWR